MATFIDTNVFVYLHDHGSPDKQARAAEFLRSTADLVISTQVLVEYYNVVTRKLSPPLAEDEARSAVQTLATLPVVTTDRDLVLSAIETSSDHRISLWDALIIEASVRGGCDRIATEDLNAGQEIRGITVVNPFARSPELHLAACGLFPT